MDKQNVIYTHNGIYVSLRKKGNGNKPVTKRQILYDSTHVSYLKLSKLRRQSRMVVVRENHSYKISVCQEYDKLVKKKQIKKRFPTNIADQVKGPPQIFRCKTMGHTWP